MMYDLDAAIAAILRDTLFHNIIFGSKQPASLHTSGCAATFFVSTFTCALQWNFFVITCTNMSRARNKIERERQRNEAYNAHISAFSSFSLIFYYCYCYSFSVVAVFCYLLCSIHSFFKETAQKWRKKMFWETKRTEESKKLNSSYFSKFYFAKKHVYCCGEQMNILFVYLVNEEK